MLYTLNFYINNVKQFSLVITAERQWEIMTKFKEMYPQDFDDYFPLGINLTADFVKSHLNDIKIENIEEYQIELNEQTQDDVFTLSQCLNLSTPIKNLEELIRKKDHRLKNIKLYDGSKLKWDSELNAFEKIGSNKTTLGYLFPISNFLVGRNKQQVKDFYANFSIDDYEIDDTKNLIRVIAVYRKKDNQLEYNILNSDINRTAFLFHNVPPANGDSLFYLNPYQISEELYNEYKKWVNPGLEFNFAEKNYFFETLPSEAFILPYKKILSLISPSSINYKFYSQSL